jgi:hypothetical protein
MRKSCSPEDDPHGSAAGEPVDHVKLRRAGRPRKPSTPSPPRSGRSGRHGATGFHLTQRLGSASFERYRVPQPGGSLRGVTASCGSPRARASGRWGLLRRPACPISDEARASAATASYVMSFLDELRESPMAMRQAASLVDFDAKPLIVVTARHEGHSRCCHVGSDLKPPELARRFSSGSVRVPGRGSPADLHVVPSRRCGGSRSWVGQPKIVRRDPLAAEPPSTARRTRRSVAKQPPAARRPA